MPSPAELFASLLFGLIGMAVFGYGKKTANIPHVMIGLCLMGFPYFVSSVWLLYAIGIGLCVAVYWWRD
ncbi:hypothetical protein GCM10027046_03510 [Uliginosibacterium flavum]|uniref:Amino acid transport protein n=1 Tax=Uliginosibacterium flavum TaxID=1396831 RepID=A0ABV2TJH3_9RHOO